MKAERGVRGPRRAREPGRGSRAAPLSPHSPRMSGRGSEAESPPPWPDVEEGPAAGAWTDRPASRPSHLRWSRDPGLGAQVQQRTEPAGGAPHPVPRIPYPAGDLSLVRGAPPVVVATGRCWGNQGELPPRGPKRSQALLWATGRAGSHAHLRPLPIQAPGRAKTGDKPAGFLRGPGAAEALLGDGTKS